MGETYYYKPWCCYCREIKLNGVSTIVCSGSKEYLDNLPYHFKSEVKDDK